MRYSLVAMALASACTVGPPAGFSTGDHWTLPLVDPLDDDVLATPVTIGGYGPYLFAIDPDANVSEIDTQVVTSAQLRTGKGPRRLDEAGNQVERVYAELIDLKVGNLTIAKRPAMVVPVGLYDTATRHFAGVIGRDVLDDSLVFGFDRDQGIAMLATEKAFRPPASAVDFPYHAVASRMPDLEVQPVPRRLARVQVNGELYSMHLDLGAKLSQLRESHWASVGLTTAPTELTLVDEAATPRTVKELGTARSVVLAAATRDRVPFIAYDDQRWDTEGVEGALGLDFFSPFSVWMSWERSTCYLTVRGDPAATTTARLARWGNAMPRCEHPGCVTTAVTSAPAETAASDRANAPPSGDAASPPAPAPGEIATADPVGAASVLITVQRDPAAAKHALQVVLAPVAVPGRPTPGWLVANLPAEVDQVAGRIGAAYAGATLQVLDVSPFPRSCPDGAAGCLTVFAPAAPAAPVATPPPSGPPAPPTVASAKLHRLTGDPAIAPNQATQQAIAAAGGSPAIAIVRVCLTADGKVESDRMIKTTKVPAYDEQLLADIKATWTFEPVAIGGAPVAACSSFTIRPR